MVLIKATKNCGNRVLANIYYVYESLPHTHAQLLRSLTLLYLLRLSQQEITRLLITYISIVSPASEVHSIMKTELTL